MYVNYCIPIEWTVFQSPSCMHRQNPYHTCYQVVMVTLFWAQKRKLDAECSIRVCEMKSMTCSVMLPLN